LKIGVFARTGSVWPKNEVEDLVIVHHQPFFVSENYDKRSFM